MAKKTPAPAPVVAQEQAPAPAVVQVTLPSGVVQAQLALPTLGTVVAARNVMARAASLQGLPTAASALTLRAGKPCRVRVPYTQAAWAACEKALREAGGTAPAPALAAASTGDFVTYAVRRGWLVPA